MEIPKELAGRFSIEDELTKRPSSVIFRGRDKELDGREVAVKVFLARPDGNGKWIAEFEDQLIQLRSASHQTLVPIIAGGCDQGWFYMAMELLSGGSLRDYLKNEGGPLDEKLAVSIISDVARGVKELHETGIIHGHLDSRAVLFKGEEIRIAGYSPKVIAEMQKLNTSAGGMLVEPAYIAPEQVEGNSIDGRADIYSLSVLLFELATGERPFSGGNPLALALARLNEQPQEPSSVNESISTTLNSAILRGLAKDPSERFQTVDEFLAALGQEQAEQKNPLAGMAPAAERIGGSTETIATSMSTDSIKHMLAVGGSVEPVVDTSSTASFPASQAAETIGVARKTISSAPAAEAQANAASVMIVRGNERGKRFSLTSSQTTVGSDSSCDISLSGKDISARFAIIVKRGNGYTVGPLSAEPLTINGQPQGDTSEHTLVRGDVIDVGDYQLRFIEPGEVFSLQDEVAERVIDRKESTLPKRIAMIAVGVLGVSLTLLLAYYSTVVDKEDSARAKSVRVKKEKKELIAKLRSEGDALFKSGAYIEPVGASAKTRFTEILELNPDDTYAKRRLREIDEIVDTLKEKRLESERMQQKVVALLKEGDRHAKAGSYLSPPGANAKESYQAALQLDPTNETAQKKMDTLNELMSNLLGRINGHLASAKELMSKGNFVAPPEENAFAYLTKVQRIDPENLEAREMLYDMAAKSIYRGDKAKAAAKLTDMRKAYLEAQALGVDPAFIKPRQQGAELIRKSSSSVIIYDRNKDDSKKPAQTSDKYLNTEEILRRIAEFELADGVSGQGQRKFIDVDDMQ